MVVSYLELLDLISAGVIVGVKPEDVNGTSIDVYLGDEIKIEARHPANPVVSLRDKENLEMTTLNLRDLPGGFYDLKPNEFILACTVEKFNLPANLSAEFKLNSSGARIGLENALATWGDPHWTDSVMTLELKNFCQHHTIRLDAGCRIGQIILHKSEPVPADRGYGVRGRYNRDSSVQQVKAEVPTSEQADTTPPPPPPPPPRTVTGKARTKEDAK